jgi:hypothetical protein
VVERRRACCLAEQVHAHRGPVIVVAGHPRDRCADTRDPRRGQRAQPGVLLGVSLLDEVAGDDQRRGPHLRLEDRLERKLNQRGIVEPESPRRVVRLDVQVGQLNERVSRQLHAPDSGAAA